MKKFKLLKILRNKSNLDYYYYLLFNNIELKLKYNVNKNYNINYIIYILNSQFGIFYNKYKKIYNYSITDVFLERISLSNKDKVNFLNMKFKKLFWLRFNKVSFSSLDYEDLIKFLTKNSLDLNRLFLENLNLKKEFFKLFKNLKGFNKLGFINLDNNNLEDIGLQSILYFLNKNNIKLEYFSLINTKITKVSELLDYLHYCNNLRILDLSSNKIRDKENILNFIKNNRNIKELFLRNIEFSNLELKNIYDIFEEGKTNIYTLRLSLNKNQKKYIKKFNILGKKLSINFDINIIGSSNINIYSTIYIKGTENKDLEKIKNNYFYVLNNNNLDLEFNNLIKNKSEYLNDGINLFLFDFNDYSKIDYLLENFNFNYIYLENYFISDADFIYFINIIKKQKNKVYKINLMSIEINEFQLDYLINNFPKNIFYIEVNLNKIEKNRELYINKILKNKAFIFENMELYKKIFK